MKATFKNGLHTCNIDKENRNRVISKLRLAEERRLGNIIDNRKNQKDRWRSIKKILPRPLQQLPSEMYFNSLKVSDENDGFES